MVIVFANVFPSCAAWNLTSHKESLGTLLGEFEKSIDAFIIVALMCFVIGVPAEGFLSKSTDIPGSKYLLETLCEEHA